MSYPWSEKCRVQVTVIVITVWEGAASALKLRICNEMNRNRRKLRVQALPRREEIFPGFWLAINQGCTYSSGLVLLDHFRKNHWSRFQILCDSHFAIEALQPWLGLTFVSCHHLVGKTRRLYTSASALHRIEDDRINVSGTKDLGCLFRQNDVASKTRKYKAIWNIF